MVPGSRKKNLPRAPPPKKRISFRSCSRPPRKKSALSGRWQNDDLIQNCVPAAERKKIFTFSSQFLLKPVCFPCIPLYFHVFSHILNQNLRRPRRILFRIAPRPARKKILFFRGPSADRYSFRLPCWAEIKRNLPQTPLSEKRILFRSPFWREIKKSLAFSILDLIHEGVYKI